MGYHVLMGPPTSCEQQDYLELACMRGYELRAVTRDGHIVEGRAIDIRMDDNRNEFLVIRSTDREFLVRLSAVTLLEPLSDDARFGPLVLSSQ